MMAFPDEGNTLILIDLQIFAAGGWAGCNSNHEEHSDLLTVKIAPESGEKNVGLFGILSCVHKLLI